MHEEKKGVEVEANPIDETTIAEAFEAVIQAIARIDQRVQNLDGIVADQQQALRAAVALLKRVAIPKDPTPIIRPRSGLN